MDLSEKCQWAKMSAECAMNTPSEIHFNQNGVYVSACWIPYDYKNAYKVYFVSDKSGNEFGQFHNLVDALTKARKMTKYSLTERKQFDL